MHRMSPLRALVALGLIATGCTASATGQVAVNPSPSPTTGASPAASPGTAASPAARITGESKAVFGAQATLYAVPGAEGYDEIGFELPLAAIEGAPATGENKAVITTLRFSEAVRNATFLDHLDIDYNPHGHEPPGTYDVPHFDFHFFGIDEAKKKAIDCADETAAPAERVPAGYMFLPPPKGQCVPMMGYHASDMSSPELNQASPSPFTRSMILGYYGGDIVFVEPMATRAFLLEKQDFTLPVGQPEAIGRQTAWPKMFHGTFDASRNTWVFALRGWTKMAK